MFSYIGGKIKTLAVTICIVGMLASLAFAIVLWSHHDEYDYVTRTYSNTIWQGIGVLIGGCAGSWTGCFCLYGFGELIEETALNRQINEKILKQLGMGTEKEPESASTVRDVPVAFSRERKPEGTIRARNVATGSSSGGWVCKACGTRNLSGDVMCKDCGLYK